MIRVLIVDDHALFRQGLRSLLTSIANIEVVGEAENGASAISQAVSLAPDLVLMDINMPGCDGLEATRRIKEECPNVKILIVSMYVSLSNIRQSLRIGATGFIFKGSPFNELKEALENVRENNWYLSPALLGPILYDYIKIAPSKDCAKQCEKLTQRENEILKLLIRNFSRHEIAEQLFISPKTVDRHKSNLKAKLGVKNGMELREFGWLTENF